MVEKSEFSLDGESYNYEHLDEVQKQTLNKMLFCKEDIQDLEVKIAAISQEIEKLRRDIYDEVLASVL